MWAALEGAGGTRPAPTSPPTAPPSWCQSSICLQLNPGINLNWAQLPTGKRGSRGKDELEFDPTQGRKWFCSMLILLQLGFDRVENQLGFYGQILQNVFWPKAWVLDSRGSIYGKTRFDHKKAKIVYRRATLHINSFIANLKTGRGQLNPSTF